MVVAGLGEDGMGVEVGAEVGMGFRMGRSGGRLTWPDRAEQGRENDSQVRN